MADINNINSLSDLQEVIADYLKTPRVPKLKGSELKKILTKVIEFTPGARAVIDANTPVAADEAEAVVLELEPYTEYITPTGEVRYKLPAGEPPDAPTDGIVNNEDHTFTFTGGEE